MRGDPRRSSATSRAVARLAFAALAFNLARAATMPTAPWATLRRRIITVPARLATAGRRLVVQLPKHSPRAAAWKVLWDNTTTTTRGGHDLTTRPTRADRRLRGTPPQVRVLAGLVLLFAQPVNRLTRLTVDDVDLSSDAVRIRFTRHWAEVPAPFAGLLAAHVAARPDGPTTVNATSDWLFPGTMPGQPLKPGY